MITADKTWQCGMCGERHRLGESHLQVEDRKRRRLPSPTTVLAPEPQWSPYVQGGDP